MEWSKDKKRKEREKKKQRKKKNRKVRMDRGEKNRMGGQIRQWIRKSLNENAREQAKKRLERKKINSSN